MNRFLLILGMAILYGCASREINISNEKLLPKDQSFTLVGDSNFTGIPSFQELFPIEDLNYLVKEGLQNNPSWNSQLARLEMKKIKAGISVTDSKPKLSARLGWQEGEEKTRESNFEKSKVPNLQTGMLFNWEIDLWGKWRLLQKASLLHLKEAEYLTESARISFVHEIAETWLLLCGKQEQAQILQRAIASQKKSLDFYRQRISAGLDDNISFARQNVVYDQLKLEEARSLRELEIIKIRLSSLMGQPLNTELPEIRKLSQIEPPILPKIFPTNALKKRPDVKAKEVKLRENLLLEKNSKYELYPSLALQMSGISMGADLSKPFSQWKASFGPVFNFPIWSPKKKIILETTRAQSEVYKQEWKEIIFLAIEEIEIATKSFLMSRAEYELAKKSSQDTAAIVEKTRQRLTAGLVTELELLEDERQFLRTNMIAVESKMQVFQFALSLSKSLGLR